MRKKQTFQFDHLALGTCYYPEQWDKSLWQSDLERMKTAGISSIRIAEFAWSKTEQEEGVFTFDFFDSFLDLAEQEGMKVIFSTPTATPPAWLTERYPEVLNCRKDGVPFRHGMRRHYNYNSPKYRELSARIVEKLAEHYAGRPCIIGWQIDNELNCEVDEFYSPADSQAFRRFLQKRYGSLEALNEAWGTAFWNQNYTDWSQVYVPRVTVNGSTNPHQQLDYSRFISESAISFCKMQADIIARYKKPGDFITTNGMFANIDNCRLTDQALDIYMYDSYPNFAYAMGNDPLNDRRLRDRRWSRNLTEVRAICPHFGIMEQQVGSQGWNVGLPSPVPKPGQLTLWAFQSIAHGADYVSFFRWRSATFGTEMYWLGILDYDSRDNRKLAEVSALSRRLALLEKKASLTGSRFVADVALLRDYDNLWDARTDLSHGKLHYESEDEIFVACQLSHTPLDFCFINRQTSLEELSRYKLLIYPHPYIISQEEVDLLSAYVASGGTLIIGARSGMKDERGHCVTRAMPGLLASLTGTSVEDYTLVGPADGQVPMDFAGKSLDSGIFNDILAVTESQEPGKRQESRVIARYSGNYYKGEPAAVESLRGKGRVIHFGGTFTRENTQAFLSYCGAASPYQQLLQLPADCELCVRSKNGTRFFVVLNFSAQSQQMQLHVPLKNAETAAMYAEKAGESVVLPPYGVLILQQDIK